VRHRLWMCFYLVSPCVSAPRRLPAFRSLRGRSRTKRRIAHRRCRNDEASAPAGVLRYRLAVVYARSGRQTRRCFRESTPVGCKSRPPMSDFAPRCDSQKRSRSFHAHGRTRRPFCTGRLEDLGLRCANCWHLPASSLPDPSCLKLIHFIPPGQGAYATWLRNRSSTSPSCPRTMSR